MLAVLSLGSNLGDRRANLRAGLEIVAMRMPVLDVSPLYRSGAVGRTDQPDYLNCVALAACADPEEALVAAHAAEEARGRLRSLRWGPRTLDVDVVDVDGIEQPDPRLTLPHPRAHERAFVLRPWLDLVPDAVVAGRGPARVLLGRLPEQDLEQVGW